jgi:hypothetical protein
MSSYYTTASLEEIRRAELHRKLMAELAEKERQRKQLKDELSKNVRRMENRLQSEFQNDVKLTKASNIVLTVEDKDDAGSGYDIDETIDTEALSKASANNMWQRQELNLSALMEIRDDLSPLEMEILSWIERIEERTIYTKKDRDDYERLTMEIKKLNGDESIDIEDKLNAIKMRVSAYLQAKEECFSEEEIASNYEKYCSICELLDISPKKLYPYEVEEEIEKMILVLEKRAEEEFIRAVISDAMEELGCSPKESVVLDNTPGKMYSVEGNPLCDVFVGSDGRGIMFEPIGESKNVSLDKKRQIESSAKNICSMYSLLEER